MCFVSNYEGFNFQMCVFSISDPCAFRFKLRGFLNVTRNLVIIITITLPVSSVCQVAAKEKKEELKVQKDWERKYRGEKREPTKK